MSDANRKVEGGGGVLLNHQWSFNAYVFAKMEWFQLNFKEIELHVLQLENLGKTE